MLPKEYSACSPYTCGTDREKIKHLKGKCGPIEKRLDPLLRQRVPFFTAM